MNLSFVESTGICIVDDFASPEDCAHLIKYVEWAKKRTHPDDRSFYPDPPAAETSIEDYWLGKTVILNDIPPFYEDILDSINLNVRAVASRYIKQINNKDLSEYYFGDDLKTLTHYKKNSPGMGYHYDDGASIHPLEKYHIPQNYVEFGIVLYLSSNFEGGELFYPDLNFTIQPKTGTLVLHPANVLHGVKEITSGDRYVMTTFIYSQDPKLN